MATRHSNDGAIHLAAHTPARHDPLTGFPEPPGWMADANCLGTDPEAFFPEKGGSTREAKGICARCTVQAECLNGALERDERFGIYGGLSERDRRRLSRAMGGTKTCRYTDCHEPTWSKSASHCLAHQPYPATTHTEKEPA